MALLGVQPQFTQEPPGWFRSTSATRWPAPARARARGTPRLSRADDGGLHLCLGHARLGCSGP